ncbi:MAG: endolytic transglycosylase MltG [Candidatus Hydrogenedentota bacterium]
MSGAPSPDKQPREAPARGADAPFGRFGFPLLLVRIVLVAWAVVALLALGAGFTAYVLYDHATQPGTPGKTVSVAVPEGITKQEVGEVLVDAGLLEMPVLWRVALVRDGAGTPIQHGVYELPEGLSALQLLRRMYEGPVRPLDVDRFRVTIPEGLSLAQMAERFDDPEAFLEAASDPELIAELGLDVNSLEGFLLPETYFFDEEPTERDVVRRMAEAFQETYERIAEGLPRIEPLTAVTVASLVEEEARVDEERPQVAAVIYNRLDKNMPLQLDATLQYALGKYGQRLLDADKEVDSPYNTYQNPGLPPGPISNPGKASLRAALRPANVDYLYFVSNADGRTHTFSRTLAEHNRAVARFRREIAGQRRAP